MREHTRVSGSQAGYIRGLGFTRPFDWVLTMFYTSFTEFSTVLLEFSTCFTEFSTCLLEFRTCSTEFRTCLTTSSPYASGTLNVPSF